MTSKPDLITTSSNNITTSLLSRAHSPASVARVLSEKIKHRPLLLKPSDPPIYTTSTTTNAQNNNNNITDNNARHRRRLLRAAKLSARKKHHKPPAPLSARQKRSLGIYDIPRAEQKYAIYEPLHALWLGYIREILGLSQNGDSGVVGADAAAKLASADFHGAELLVVRSRCVSRVGLRGIVVRDERGVFVLVTKGDAVKVVPKEGTVFRIEVPLVSSASLKGGDVANTSGGEGALEGGGEQERKKERNKKKNLVFELLGDQFRYRAADRANKKFKTHFLPDL